MYNLLIDYSECCKNFGQSVNKALREGLQNHERYLKLDNALSPRSIIVEKKEGTDKASKSEGNYQIVFVLDDDSRHVIHFGRKQSHLLYILFLLCSRKNGLLTDFFQKDESREFDVIDVVALLAQLIFPSLRNKAKEARLSALELGPDKSFSDSLQKMKAPLVKCLKEAEMSDDLYWYMPFAVNLKKKQLYNMHMPSTKIILPAEFQPIIDALPDAKDFLEKHDIYSDNIKTRGRNIFLGVKECLESGVGQEGQERGTAMWLMNGMTSYFQNEPTERSEEIKFDSMMDGNIYKKVQKTFDLCLAAA